MGRRSRKSRGGVAAPLALARPGRVRVMNRDRPRRGLSGGCISLGKLSAQGKRMQHDEGEERRFSARFLVMEHASRKRCNQSQS